jgi:arylsulfatase A-like enzyme
MEGRESIEVCRDSGPDPEYRVNATLVAMVSRLDAGTGRLLEKLAELDLQDNTIIFFCSDNGGKETYASQAPFRKGKGWLYEGGIRVPMIVRWPGRIEAGSWNAAITSTIDLYPTLLELAGLSPPGHPLDGVSLAGELLGDGNVEERIHFWHYPHYHRGSGMKPASAVRKGKFKLIEWHEAFLSGKAAWELYDIESDPGETQDLSSDNPEILEELRVDLHRWRAEIGAQMPTLNPE